MTTDVSKLSSLISKPKAYKITEKFVERVAICNFISSSSEEMWPRSRDGYIKLAYRLSTADRLIFAYTDTLAQVN